MKMIFVVLCVCIFATESNDLVQQKITTPILRLIMQYLNAKDFVSKMSALNSTYHTMTQVYLNERILEIGWDYIAVTNLKFTQCQGIEGTEKQLDRANYLLYFPQPHLLSFIPNPTIPPENVNLFPSNRLQIQVPVFFNHGDDQVKMHLARQLYFDDGCAFECYSDNTNVTEDFLNIYPATRNLALRPTLDSTIHIPLCLRYYCYPNTYYYVIRCIREIHKEDVLKVLYYDLLGNYFIEVYIPKGNDYTFNLIKRRLIKTSDFEFKVDLSEAGTLEPVYFSSPANYHLFQYLFLTPSYLGFKSKDRDFCLNNVF